MKQALATGLITTQQKVIANPPTFVRITKKYQRRASTPALSNTSSLTNSVSGVAGRAGSPEVSRSNQSGACSVNMIQDEAQQSVTVDDKAVKEGAVIDEVAKQLCVSLRLSSSTFNVNDESMKQALASALIVTQQNVIANSPTFVTIQKKYQRRANTPAMSNISNASSMSSDPSSIPHVLNGAGRSGSPEVSSSNILGPQSTMSGGSIGVADFMDPKVLKTAKL
ncbi:TPA: hypothetical protein ACH3X1_001656 [Trebouxia sp. C0004]